TQVIQGADAAPSPGDTTEAPDAEEPDDVSSPLDTSPEEQDIESPTVLPFLASYGAVETVAGTAYITGKAVNGWGLSFEGGPAVNAELSRPHMTQADAQGRLFIADKDAHAIRRVDPDGTIHTVAGTNEAGDGPDTPTVATEVALHSPNGIWVRWDGTVYVLDLENEKIRRLGPDGLLETFFETGSLGTGRGLWVAEDEQLAWISAGTEIKRWTPETGIEVVATGFVSLGNIAVKSNGQVAIADRGSHQAWWVGANGALLPLAGNGTTTGGGDGFAGLDTGIPGLRGIWFPPDGGVLLCGHIASRLYWMDDAGILHLMLDGAPDGTHAGDGEHWSTPGLKISEPRAVSMDHQGNILLTEHDGGFIRRILRTGPLP
ncbi:MAG: hypothetical protein QF464_17960, partial [Myxococcota bacterium]|nr:hypothetical protein [Myxococcota bacterium]